jgi:hypothetical protein
MEALGNNFWNFFILLSSLCLSTPYGLASFGGQLSPPLAYYSFVLIH